MGAAIAGIELDCLLEEGDGGDVVLRRAVAVEFPAAQKGIISRGNFGFGLRTFRLLVCREIDRERCHDLLGNAVLEGKHVSHGAVVAIGPKVPAGGRVDQLGIDAHLVAHAPHAALQHVAHAQFFGYLAHLHLLALVAEGRIAGDDEQAGDLG